jgi:hypothetical protein
MRDSKDLQPATSRDRQKGKEEGGREREREAERERERQTERDTFSVVYRGERARTSSRSVIQYIYI